MRCLMTIRVLDPAVFRDIFGNLSEYPSLEAYSLKKDKLTVSIFSNEEDEAEDKELTELATDVLSYFGKNVKKVKKIVEMKEYNLKKEWVSYCEPCSW